MLFDILKQLGCVQTWWLSTVPENDSRWALMWTHLFFKFPRGRIRARCPCPSTRSRPCTRALNWALIPCGHTFFVSSLALYPETTALRTQNSLICLNATGTCLVWLRSHLVPEHGARERFLMGTNVNRPFSQVSMPEFGRGARARVQGLDLELGHWPGDQYIGYPESEHSTILCPCPDTSARAPSVNTAFVEREPTYQHIGYPVSEDSTILCRCPGTSAWAPSVNTALNASFSANATRCIAIRVFPTFILLFGSHVFKLWKLPTIYK